MSAEQVYREYQLARAAHERVMAAWRSGKTPEECRELVEEEMTHWRAAESAFGRQEVAHAER